MATVHKEKDSSYDAPQYSDTVDSTLFEQAVRRQYGNLEIITSAKKTYQKLKECKVGSEFLIVSNIQFDDIYTKGIELLGYEFLTDKNMVFRTDDSEVNQKLSNKHFTVVKRMVEKDEANALMFENQLFPERVALHVLGGYARKAGTAQSPEELWYAVDDALNWLMLMRDNKLITEKDFDSLAEKYMQKIGHIESQKMTKLGLSRTYDIEKIEAGFAQIAIKKMKNNWENNKKTLEAADKRIQVGKN